MNKCHPSIRSVLLPIHPLDKARHVGNVAGDFTSLRLKRELRQMEMAGPPEFQLGSLQIALQ